MIYLASEFHHNKLPKFAAKSAAGTNNVYSFIISTESLLLAENLGFQSLSSLDSELSIETVDCP
jgi:hypothetical protein